ncbi:hypothetical protein BDK51DRAFT_24519 [Blyttiomyces helicus]|uniref:LUC7-domain-containing protein n=1 Tax=Blyttiomyces helicus TaxID=388810 RepID=A0A4P9WJH4_9FUNG|nr:hypothetical protein BDK51DRAFT_24519 [Blyttiomyces helicus]|eukprot:RKO92093.1 hypothetical protein BDK51DRAFT_24519 [Blyttiomyces helicus]
MGAAEEQRKLLEALMGKEALGGTPDNLDYKDPTVCKDFLSGLCPHDLFTNTKMDLGPCARVHSVKLKEDFERDLHEKKHDGFREEWFRSLSEFVKDCDRKIDNAHRRLDKTPEDAKANELMREVGDLTNEIATLIAQAEALGEEGKVAESIKALEQVDNLKKAKAAKDAQLKSLIGGEANNQHQKLRVCDRCSAYLSIFDSDRRLADHFGGKMHLGFVSIREKVQELADSGMVYRGPLGGISGGNRGGPGDYPRRDDRVDRDRRDSGGYRDDRGYGGGGGGYRDDRRGGYDRYVLCFFLSGIPPPLRWAGMSPPRRLKRRLTPI